MKKRILSLVLVLAMLLSLLPAVPAVAAVTRYNLFVEGVQVTSENRTNILGQERATVSFDPAENKLTLDDAHISLTDADAIANGIPGLTIYVKSYSSVNGWRYKNLSSNPSGIISTADLTITGPGRLYTRGDFGCGIWLTNGASLHIRDAFVEAYGTNGGIVAHKSGSQLVITNSMVFAKKSKSNGAISNFTKGIVFYDVGISDPVGGVVGGGYIKDAKGNVAEQALIQPTTPANPYDLWVCGVRVNGRNRNDILGDGVACYDDATKTLTFDEIGVQWMNPGGYSAVRNEIPGLTIRFVRLCYLRGTGWDTGDGAPAILSSKNLTLTGPGTYSPGDCACAVKMTNGATLTVDNGRVENIVIENTYYGLSGSNTGEKLVIRGSRVYLVTEKDSIANFNGGITLQNCSIRKPEGGKIQGGKIVEAGGTVANKVHIEREEYDLWVKDVQVTGGNQDDILGDGVFAYNQSSNTLTVNGDCSAEGYVNVIKNKIKGLTVRAAKSVTLSAHQSVILTSADMKITGSGKLTLRSRDQYGIFADTGAAVTVDGADLDATGYFAGIHGSSGSTSKLTVRNSRVHAANGNPQVFESGGVQGFYGGITLEGCAFFTPAGGKVVEGTVKNKSGKTAPEILIDVPEEYELYIAGTKVTTANAFDILGDGAFSYDPETNTLTVEDDAECGNQYMIANRIPDLTVYVKWDARLVSTFSTIHTNKNIRITGPGKLTLRSTNAAFYVEQGATVTLENARLDVSGNNYGIVGHGPDKLVIRESAVKVHGDSTAAISGFASIDLQNCRITKPADAKIQGGAVLKNDSTVANDVTIDQNYDLEIAGTQVTCANASDIRGDGVFSYDPTENKLTVSGNCTTAEHITVWNNISGLTLYVAEDSRFTTSDNTIAAGKNMTITGPGKLTLNSTATNGITVYNGATVTIDHAVIETIGCDIGALAGGQPALIVNTSEVHVDGNVENFKSITITGCTISVPNNAVNKNGSIYESNGSTLAASVAIDVLKYDLRVAGVRVTSANAPDILGDGNFIYDAAENKLTVQGYCERAEGIIIWNHIPGLTVYNRYARTLSTSDNVIATDADMTLTGPGKLTLASSSVNGILVYDGATLNIENANLEISGNQGIYGLNHAGLNIRNSTIRIASQNKAVYGFDKGLTFFNCEINEPAGAKVKNGAIVETGGADAKEVTIGAPEYTSYGIWINGNSVSSSNAWDVLGNGVFSYDVKTNTLHVKDDYAIDSNSTLIRSEDPGLTITADKDVTLTTKKWSVLEATEDLTITGTYKITMVNENEDFTTLSIENGATVTIDRANVEIRGSYGISGYAPSGKDEKVIVKGSKVLIDVDTEAVSDLSGGLTLENCEITEPASTTFTGGMLYNDHTGDAAKKVVIGNVKKYSLSIANTQVDVQNAPDVLRNGVFSYDPEKNVLTVNGNCSTAENITIWNSIPDLTIYVAGDSTLRTSDNTIATSKNITITGPGTLTLNSTQTSGILAYGTGETVTIESARIKTVGCGIIGSFLGSNHRLIIKNSEVEVDGHITGFKSFTLTDCSLITPADGVMKADGVYQANGTTLAEGVEIGDPRVPELIEQPAVNPPVEKPENPFVDVKSSDWFYDAVLWAVNQHPPITSGTDATHFSPYLDCSRAQVVQFLYNAAGNPAPKSSTNPFVDVKSSDWYYKAVLWAVENNITAGTDATHFSPSKACTRTEVVQFIWNTKGNTPAKSKVNPFVDVKSSDWFYGAVLWAVENNITKGTDATHFSPTKKCTRSQIVQFLYNARNLA